MSVSLVMTIVAPDEPGLVESIAEIIRDHGGNWEESRMARLAGQFAGILKFEAPSDNADALRGALQALEDDGLRVVVRETDDQPPPPDRHRLRLEFVGHDRPGIVHHLSEAIAARGVNVDELETEVAAAPMTGEMLFTAHAELSAPAATDMAALRDELENIAAELSADVRIEDIAETDTGRDAG